MAEALSRREKNDITISFERTDGRKEVIHAKYDPLFNTVELGNATFPVVELKYWLRLFYGADGKTIKVTY
jgi:hypothetical protein